MTDTCRDTPNVMIFPPLIPLSVLVVGLVLNFFMPLGLLAHVLFLGRIVVGAIAFVVGVVQRGQSTNLDQKIRFLRAIGRPVPENSGSDLFSRRIDRMLAAASIERETDPSRFQVIAMSLKAPFER